MRKRITAFSVVLSILMTLIVMPTAVVRADFKEISEEEYAGMTQHFKYLDISGVANRGFADDVAGDGVGGWSDQGSENDLSSFDLRGVNTLFGVEYNIIDPDKNGGKSCVVLRGQNDESVPTSAEIAVDDKIAGVYFLHASAWLSDIVGRYVFVYEDGSEEAVTIRGNNDVFNWWGSGTGDYTRTAWSGSNRSTSSVSLYTFACSNPQPAKKVKLIRAETDGDTSYLMIVAATATDAGPYMMVDSDSNPDMSGWFAYQPYFRGETAGTALDASYLLDAPAGNHGYIHASGENMYFEDGTKARFWGVVVCNDSIFDASKKEIDDTVQTIASLGFNCVRLHHLDAGFGGTINIYNGRGIRDQVISEYRMDKLCYFLAKAKEKGIYWLIDQTVSKNPREDNNIQSSTYSAMAAKPLAWFDAQEQQNRFKYSKDLLTWKNPYTGMTIGEDPAFVALDLENENGAGNFLPEIEYYNKEAMSLMLEWLKEKYKTDDALKAAWEDNNSGRIGLRDNEGIEKQYIEMENMSSWSKFTNARKEDYRRFCVDLEIDYCNRYTEFIRGLGVKALITLNTANVGFTSPGNAYVHAKSSDFSDIHSYWTLTSQGEFSDGNRLMFNGPVSAMSKPTLEFIGDMACQRIYSMPHTITEWNSCAVNPTQVEGCLLLSAFGSMQNWAPFYFEYGGTAFTRLKEPSTEIVKYKDGLLYQDPNVLQAEFSIESNPAKKAVMPSCSMMFLRGDVSEAETGYYDRMTEQNAIETDMVSRDALYAMIGKTGYMFDVGKTGSVFNISGLNNGLSNDNSIKAASDTAYNGNKKYISATGELTSDFKNKIFTADTLYSQAVCGFIGGQTISLANADIEVNNDYAAVSLTSVDKNNRSIIGAERLVLTLAGETRNYAQIVETDPERGKQKSVIKVAGKYPILAEQITGEITLKLDADYTVYPLTSSGERKNPLAITKINGGFKFSITKDTQAMNFEIVRN